MATFFLFVGLLFLAATVFTVWLIVRVVGFFFGLIFGAGGIGAPPRHMRGDMRQVNAPQGWKSCGNLGCRSANPPHARFCRRCGSAVMTAGMPRMRYVA